MITKLKMAMFIKEIKQTDIAKQAGCHRAYINRIVTGRQKPSKKIRQVFKEFGIDIPEGDHNV